MDRKKLLPPAMLDQLRRYLYEVNFVYRKLPAVLERAGLAATMDRLGTFFRDQVVSINDHRSALEALVNAWGEQLRPCACEEVDELLNEIRHALAARDDKATMETRVFGIVTALQKIVMARLSEGVELARKLGDTELVERLESLMASEVDQVQLTEQVRGA